MNYIAKIEFEKKKYCVRVLKRHDKVMRKIERER